VTQRDVPEVIVGMSDLSDAELVRQVQRGETERYAVLVERYYDVCMRYAFRMLGDRQDAEEVVQDAFVRAHGSLHRYQDRDRFRGWLLRILVNRCRSVLRRQRQATRLFVPYDSAVDAAATVEFVDPCWSRAVQRALQQLSPPLREALLLRCVEELPYEEIARTTGASVSAVKMRVMRAREQIRTLLQEKQNA
jgi:RNA polymerase sigma-70 factor, ECF subfamily